MRRHGPARSPAHFTGLLLLSVIGCGGNTGMLVSGDAQAAADGAIEASSMCSLGQFRDTRGVCCPALGCAPRCTNGVKRDTNGCETCQCNEPPTDAGTDGGLAVCAGDKAPSGTCLPATAPPCRLTSGLTCQCTTRCSGVAPPPGQEYVYACATPNPAACPASTPMNASACGPSGLMCRYGTCGGSTATCQNGKWTVVFIPPPP
jgi:hypothetical protein